MIRIGEHWLADFASCNYLGLRPGPRDHRGGPRLPRRVGHAPELVAAARQPGRSTRRSRTRLTALLGSPDSLVLPTITHIHMSVIPLLAASGTIFLDARAHKTIYDGCQVARARGAAVKRFRFEDPDHLDQLLRAERDPHSPGLHGRGQQHDRQRAGHPGVRRRRAPARRAAVRRRRARVRRDRRAHARTRHRLTGCAATASCATAASPTTTSCSSAGFSKAYSSLLAFIACPTEVKELLKVAAPPYLYSGPSPVASLATVLAGFDVNERAATRCAPADRATERVLDCVRPPRRRTRRTARAFRSSRSRCATTGASTRSAGCCSTAACT